MDSIHAPTLIIYGGKDELLTLRDQKILADWIPGAILKVYPDEVPRRYGLLADVELLRLP